MTHPFSGLPRLEEIDVGRGLPEDRLLGLTARLRRTETPFLLETGLGVGPSAHWHVLGAFPVGRATVHGDRWRTELGAESREGQGDPLLAVEEWWTSWRAPTAEPLGADPPFDRDGLPEFDFLGGAVGYFGYELGERLEKLPPRQTPEDQRPDLQLYLYDEVVLVARESGRAFFVHRERSGGERRRWWESENPTADAFASRQDELGSEEISLSDAQYLQHVEDIRQLIGVGDVYEVNLCRRHAFAGGADVWTLHQRLRERQPVPYGALLPWDPVQIVSASPECFLRRRGTEVLTRPIKGTVPRGATEGEDRVAAAALQANPKERAELAMIIDLERNDLGRVCLAGSVTVPEEAAIEPYSTVIHTVATVRGELAPGASPWPLLRATFPGGSITGAPKIAAMKVIRRFEPVPRKVYTGSIGWIAPNGDLDLNIAIRTIFRQDGFTYYSVGGAVTWDSDPERELRELEAKGAALRAALQDRG